MAVSREQYDEVMRNQSEGRLTVMIDTPGFRQFLDRADPEKFSSLVGLPCGGAIRLIKVLGRTDFLGFLVSSGLAIMAFGVWAFAVIPVLLFAWMDYKGRASAGRQSLVGVSFALLVAGVAAFSAPPGWDLWARAFIMSTAVTFFLIRLLYVVTSRFVFSLVWSSYEFFSAFYKQPAGALVPLLWTDPAIEE